MAKTDFRTVDEYLAAQPAGLRAVLERVRGAIRKAVPNAEEIISYQIPAYRIGGGVALYFAGWKEHVSLYPISGAMVAELGDEIAPYVAGKGTLRFPLSARLPLQLIGRIAKLRAAEQAAKQATKRAARKQARPSSANKARKSPAKARESSRRRR